MIGRRLSELRSLAGRIVRSSLGPPRLAASPAGLETTRGVTIPVFGHVDAIQLETCGMVRLRGWTRTEVADAGACFEVEADGAALSPLQVYDCYRPDVARSVGSSNDFLGFGIDYWIQEPRLGRLRVRFVGEGADVVLIDEPELSFTIVPPAYAKLRSSDRVRTRDDMYTYGPPGEGVAAEVLALTSELSGSVLDFGCGLGHLVRHLRKRGVDARGLEIDRPEIADHLPPDVRSHVELYDGRCPLPFPDHSFDHVICVETLEHTLDPAGVASELARIARSSLLVTVPDIGVVPTLFKHQVVPWHLLESTHFQFFTQRSLEALLRERWPRVRFARAVPNRVNGTTYWNSLVAICRS